MNGLEVGTRVGALWLLGTLAACGASATGTAAPTAAAGASTAAAEASRSCEQGGPCSPGTMVGFWRVALERNASGEVKVLGHERYEADGSLDRSTLDRSTLDRSTSTLDLAITTAG